MTTLGDLVTMVRFRSNMEASQFVTDAELVAYLNASLAELDDVLISTYEDYKLENYTATITSSATPYFTLPADFLKSRGVDRQISGIWQTLFPYTLQERNRMAYPAIAFPFGFAAVRYRIQGTQVHIIPEASSAATYRLWYVPQFITLASSDELPAHMSSQAWSEYAVADTCAKVLQKQDLDAGLFLAQKTALQSRIINAAKGRDAGPPKRMVDTRHRSWGRGGYN